MKKIDHILSNHFRGLTSEEERQQLESWIEESKDNRSIYNQAAQLWNELGFTTSEFTLDKQVAWEMIVGTLKPEMSREKEPIVKHLIRMAIIILVLFGIAGVASLVLKIGANVEHRAVVRGEYLLLSDGSKAYLDSGTTAKYGKDFGANDRKISLSGEAILEVNKLQNQPLVVRTSQGRVFLNGAIVDISSSGDRLEVLSINGEVIVETMEGRHILDPMKLLIVEGERKPLVVDADINLIAWKSREIRYESATVGSQLKALEKLTRCKITFTNSSALNQKITYHIVNATPLILADTLANRLGLKYKYDKGELLFF